LGSEIKQLLGPFLVLSAIATSLVSMGIIRVGHPLLHIANRWLRWLLIAVLFALLLQNPDWTGQERSFPVLFLMAFLIWFLLETMVNWAKISTFSRSAYPLFPRYSLNHDGDEWPVHPAAIKVKDWLANNEFAKVQSLKYGSDDSFVLRTTFYQDPENTCRIQIHFLPPNPSGRNMYYAISTQMEDGSKCVTDNISMPFAIYVPEDWDMVRKPLVLSLNRLLSLHEERVEALGKTPAPWDTEPLDDLEEQRRTLEQVNLSHGFLHPADYHEEYGRLTSEGCYRMWKEMWLLSYFGRPLSPRPAPAANVE